MILALVIVRIIHQCNVSVSVSASVIIHGLSCTSYHRSYFGISLHYVVYVCVAFKKKMKRPDPSFHADQPAAPSSNVRPSVLLTHPPLR